MPANKGRRADGKRNCSPGWIEKRRVPVMIINGEAELYEPKLEENRERS
ncbi:MAG TPA: hypothetical protein VFO91_01670 [Anaerolineales bacterium]|nr:hypothetical protein [Anaerolineales bacterium]